MRMMLNLKGLTHVWGDAGSGKTLFAIAIAAPLTVNHHVLWMNTDGKWSFLNPLRNNISLNNGKRENVSVVMAHGQALEQIQRLPKLINSNTRLVVIDSISRTVDLGRKDPTLWGREMLEEVMPTLSSLVMNSNLQILAINEMRFLNDHNVPLLYDIIRRFCDNDLEIRRDPTGISSILVNGNKIAETLIQENGSVIIRPDGALQEGDLNCSVSTAFV